MTRSLPGVPCWIDVATPDLDGALAFYGGLFGWRIEQDPHRLARLRGHEVAGLRAQGDARWDVTFAVDDADAIAAAAAELGGAVIVPPFDAGPARMAVVGDPFSLSRHAP